MISAFGLIHPNLLPHAIGIGVLLLAIFIWKEWQTTKRSFLYVRLALAVIAILALMALVLQPTISIKAQEAQYAILTENYKQEDLDSLKKVNPLIKIIAYDTNKPLFNEDDTPSSVLILGDGIEAYDAYQIKNLNTSFLAGAPLEGITQLKYDNTLIEGSSLTVKGRYNIPDEQHWLYLQSPDSRNLDSIKLDALSDDVFRLKTKTKAPGKFTYYLTETDSLGTTIKSEILPVQVTESRTLRILMLNSFPTFEQKYLKNFLAENGHEVVVRNRLSKGKFKYEYFNTTSRASRINSQTLQNIDVVILDGGALRALSNAQRNSLTNAVQQNGLGIYVMATEEIVGRRDALFPFVLQSNNQNTVSLEKDINLNTLPFQFTKDSNKEIHVFNDRVISAAKRRDLGYIATSLALNTYFFLLEGQQEAYASFWSTLLTSIAKKTVTPALWKTHHTFPVVDEPLTFTLQTTIAKPEVFTEGVQIPLQQDISFSDQFEGRIYPSQGWQSLQLMKDSTDIFNYFCYQASDWTTVRAFKKRALNKRLTSQSTARSEIKTLQQPIASIWFFGIFLLAMTGLWLIPKL